MNMTDSVKEKSRLTKEEWREFTKTVWHIANTSHRHHPAVFPTEIPHRLIKLFSFYGETVLDPFGGTGSTAKAAIPLGRHVICVDQNRKYTQIITRECKPLRNSKPSSKLLRTICGDSRELKLKNDSVELVVTSPPYWNKADYGGGPADIGAVAHYSRFLDRIEVVFRECSRVLVSGRKFCVVTANVNQYTDHGLLTFPLAADFGLILRKVGLVMVNEVIWSKDGTGGRWGSANHQRPIFGSYPYPPNFLFKNVHEHILIFAKPSAKKTSSKKALPYSSLVDTEPVKR
jgi:site-specific DNA-methyltransferase (adenine-specific)